MSARLWRPGADVEPLRALLARGGLLAIPTESSYGLAADPRSAAGVEAIYRLKTRDRGKPLPVVAANLAQLTALGISPDDEAIRRAATVWPAPFTVLAPISQPLPASAGEPTLAVRIPAHTQLLTLLLALGTALTATSANRSGEQPLLDPAAVAALLDTPDAPAGSIVVDGGPLPGGPPSTLAAWHDGRWNVLREGRFPASQLP